LKIYRRMDASALRTYREPNPDLVDQAVLLGLEVPHEMTEDALQAVPGISRSWVLPLRSRLSTDLDLDGNWRREEGSLDNGRGTWGYATRLGVETRIGSMTTSYFGHSFHRQLNLMDTMPWAAVTQNRLDANLEWQPLQVLRLQGASGYDLLPHSVPHGLWRFDPIRLQAGWSPAAPYNAGCTAHWHLPTGQFKTVDMSLNMNDAPGRWNWGMTGTWVNNRILPKINTEDPLAPALLTITEPRTVSDLVTVSFSSGFKLTELWRVSLYERLNLTTKQLDEQGLTLWRDLHCWEAQIGVRQRLDGSTQFSGGINLKAFPGVRAGSFGDGGDYTGGYMGR
jgi:hypothetical protein